VGQAPQIDFEVGDIGPELRVRNPRPETIIIESIKATPAILGFSAGHETEDIARAIVAQRQIPDERALAVLSPSKDAVFSVITFDPFNTSPPLLIIKVRMHWRSAARGMFSASSVTRKLSVRDVRDLQRAAEKRQPRLTILGG
jgi:hypothetical protein